MSILRNAAELTSKIKSLEAAFDFKIPAHLPFIVRLDGVNFKRYTSVLKKPFDPNFTKALQETTIDLMDRFGNITSGFCQSDEITLIGAPAPDNNPKHLLYQGRVQKIASVLSSFAASRFNHHMCLVGVVSEPAAFDARVFSVNSWLEAAQVLIWRHRHDCRRNALHAIAQAHFSKAELEGQPIKEVISKLLNEKRIDAYKEYPSANVYGSFVKRIKVDIQGENPITKQKVTVQRARLVAKSFDLITEDSVELETFVKDPYFK